MFLEFIKSFFKIENDVKKSDILSDDELRDGLKNMLFTSKELDQGYNNVRIGFNEDSKEIK